MKIIYFIFYLFFGMSAKTFGKPDYHYIDAIGGSIYFSMFLSFNIMTVLLSLGCSKIMKVISDHLGFASIFILPLLSFIFIYFSCIHKKKYLKIQERFNYMDKSLKKRLLGALIIMSYMGASIILFALVGWHFWGGK